MSSDLLPSNSSYPKVSTLRRSAALGLDVLFVWLLASLLGSDVVIRFFLFILLWFAVRVLLVAKNQGQSLGRWAFDQRLIHTQLHRTPGLLELFKREGIMGISVFLALIGLSRLTSGNAGILLLWIPLVVDCGTALFDLNRHPQTFHDRMGQTIVVSTQRGYSLDLKIQRWIDKITKGMK